MTLLVTIEAKVNDAVAGQFSEELDHLLHVDTQDSLRKLVQERKLSRRKVAGQFLYCAADRTGKGQQLSARRALLAAPGLVGPIADADLVPEELRAAIVLFPSLLDERQRRLYAGLESLKCGWAATRASQRCSLSTPVPWPEAASNCTPGRSSANACAAPVVGATRWKKNARGDPDDRNDIATRCRRQSHHRVRWTHRTTNKIADELAVGGIQVCLRTVARILHGLGYRLRLNHKRVATGSGADRDQQFIHISAQRTRFAQCDLPIVSIDTKRELVGNFKNPGRN